MHTTSENADHESIAALCAELDAGDEAQKTALAALRGSVWRLSLDPEGCRTVQNAFQVVDKKQLAQLVQELRGHVREAVPSPYANYVIQKVIELMPIPHLGFILDEMVGVGPCTSRHRFGCRIICRLLEHAASDPSTGPLIEEILSETGSLSRHVFGHHVMHAVLEHGTPEHQRRVVQSLQEELLRNAMNRSGSYVIEKALHHCPHDVCNGLADALLAEPAGIGALAQNQYGCYVVKALLRFRGEQAALAMTQLRSAAPQLHEIKYGRRLLQDLGL